MANVLSYEEVLENLNNIVDNPNSINQIKLQKPIGYSSFDYPILHYTFGNGQNNILIVGATHGNEIITTDFIIKLMKEISDGNKKFNFLDKNIYTLHFIPLLNPEGYIITTSAVKQLINQNMSEQQRQQIISEYNKRYEEDDMNSILKLNRPFKEYQKMCENIDYTCISDNHKNLKNSVKQILENNNIPKGAIISWASNGMGIDLNSNSPYNPKLTLIKSGITSFSYLRYDNIITTKPGPIGCPTRNSDGSFFLEPENKAIQSLLFELKHSKNLCAFFTYHSVAGEIYYKPYDLETFCTNETMTNLDIEKIYNKKIASLYSSKTNYRLIDDIPTKVSFNDLLRIQANGNILIELCESGNNSFGSYVEPEYTNTIKKNIEACSYVFEKLPNLKKAKDKLLSINIHDKQFSDTDIFER